MRLINVYDYEQAARLEILYELLAERTPAQSISHKEMPTFTAHEQFVESRPYAVWYFITTDEDTSTPLGNVYLTPDKEIGIQIFREFQMNGHGTAALDVLYSIHKGPFYANISPRNYVSQKFFEKEGFTHIQNTYKLEASHD